MLKDTQDMLYKSRNQVAIHEVWGVSVFVEFLGCFCICGVWHASNRVMRASTPMQGHTWALCVSRRCLRPTFANQGKEALRSLQDLSASDKTLFDRQQVPKPLVCEFALARPEECAKMPTKSPLWANRRKRRFGSSRRSW